MALFEKKKQAGGFMDEIRCDEPSYLVWKWHPANVRLGESNRENAIRWGSSLRVKAGEVAVFVCSQHGVSELEYIEGPCDRILDTENLPIIASIVGLAYEGGTPFQAEVYFINLARIIQIRFGVPFFDIYDPRFPDFGVPVAVRGTVSFSISDYREFIKLHRLNNFDLDDFQRQLRDAITRYVKNCVANIPSAENIPVIQIETRTSQINETIEHDLNERLKTNFGVTVSGVDLGAIEIDRSSEGYRQLMTVTREITAMKVKAEAHDYTERLRIQREEGQYATHKQTQSANLGAFQIEKQAEVGIAGAQALGRANAGDSGGAASGGSNNGFNMATMMAGMAVGGAVGQNIAGAMNSVMKTTAPSAGTGATPPPFPADVYYVAVEGQARGPFPREALKQMVAAGHMTADSLIWKNGMSQWANAGSIEDLKNIFITMPPIPPSEE